jgi:photosystem II stability/assembly factor-like uncharacterized protein
MRNRIGMLTLLMPLLAIPQASIGASDEKTQWPIVTRGVDTNLRGISADFARPLTVSGDHSAVIWVCGSNGVILRSADEGKTWKRLHVDGGDKLDFRGIRSFGSSIAYVMSVGEGEKSRIYKTTDGGETWRMQYTDHRHEFFLDGLVCASEKDCFAISDPVDRKFLLLRTEDGEQWKELPRDAMPAAMEAEGVFAASNSALAFCGEEQLFFGTGGPSARVFHSGDAGRSWNVVETPLLSGNASSGIFSLRCYGQTLVAVGGDYRNTAAPVQVASFSLDHGATWKLAALSPEGFRSAVEVVDGTKWIAVGPTGEDISTDQGVHWKHSASLNLNAIFVLDDRAIFAVGPNGTVAEYNVNYLIRDLRPQSPDLRQTFAGLSLLGRTTPSFSQEAGID